MIARRNTTSASDRSCFRPLIYRWGDPLVAENTVWVFLAGLANALGLIVAVGAQNAHVLRHGLLGRHVATVVAICVASDAILIATGVYGLGAVLIAAPRVSAALAYIGTLFLWAYGVLALARMVRGGQRLHPESTARVSRLVSVTTTLVITWLNPAVYIDTVLVLGRLAESHGAHRLAFAVGAIAGSALFFTLLGFGARRAAPWLARPRVWQGLDALIAGVMFWAGWHLLGSV